MTRDDVAELAAAAGLRPPRAVTIAVTGRCNLRCQHCWVEAGLPTSAPDVPAPRLASLVDEFAAIGVETVWVTGGEPLCHPDWFAVLARCCAHPALRQVGLQTNGTLVDDEAVARLRTLPLDRLSIQVSLDGATAAAHDRVRGAGSLRRALAGVTRLAAAGLGRNVSLAFTEMRHNMDDVPALLELAERLGLRAVVGGTLVKDGSAARSALAGPEPEQYRILLARYDRDARFRALYDGYGKLSAIEWWKGRSAARAEPCALVDHPYVAADGRMLPCRLVQSAEHAIALEGDRPVAAALREAIPRWRELVALARSRPATLRACRRCGARTQCGAGCMGRALAASGSLLAVEDRCALRRAVHAWDDGRADGAPGCAPARRGVWSVRMTIDEFLAEERALIVEDAWHAVVKMKHYERDGEQATRERVELLFDEVARAIRVRDLGELLDHAERIATQRFRAGFEPWEVQTALFTLEQAIRRRALERIPAAEMPEALGLVETAIRRAKEAFARAYVSLANRARAPALDGDGFEEE